MNRLFIMCAISVTLLAPGCRDDIDELIRQGAYETAYYYHSGGMPAGSHVTVTAVINSNGGAVKREERAVSNSGKNKDVIAEFDVTRADLKKLYLMLKQNGFFDLKTKKTNNPGARTVYLKIKKGGAVYIREESPVVSMAAHSDTEKFMAIISEFNAFVKDRLPADRKRLVDY